MNLFVIVRHGPAQVRARAALQAMTEVYPLLDPGTLTTFGTDSLYAAVLHTAHAAAAPRRYHAERRGAFTLYDGCPVEPKGRFAAHDAAELDHHWDELHETLEGSFFAARLEGETLELLSDPLGMHQTFYWQDGEQLLVSNSVRLIAEVLGLRELDPVGASLYLGLGYAGGERTLTQGVRIFPEGERWRVDAGGVRRAPYFGMRDLAALPAAAPTTAALERVATDMGDLLETLAASFGGLECPITAGRDSRMLVALSVARGARATYFSAGEDDHADVQVGKAIAEALELPHEQWWRGDDAAAAWDDTSRRVVRHADGLVTLAHIQNSLHEPAQLTTLPVHLYGAGGEYARGKWLTESFLLAPQTARSAAAHTAKFAFKYPSLLTPEAAAVVRQHLDEELARLLEAGFTPKALPCAFFLHDYGRRWAGAQARQIASKRDVFAPFCTRPYVRAAFALPPALRLAEHLPYRLLEHLSPQLHAHPFAVPWRPQQPFALYAASGLRFSRRALGKVSARARRALGVSAPLKAGRARVRHDWLEAVLPALRERHLDQPTAASWEVLDRSAFERLTAPGTPADARAPQAPALFLALTLLEHERLDAERPSGAPFGTGAALRGPPPRSPDPLAVGG